MYSSNGSDNETDDSGNETDDSDNETDDSSEIFQILLQMWELLPCSHWLWHNQKVFYQSNSGLSEIYVFSPHNPSFFTIQVFHLPIVKCMVSPHNPSFFCTVRCSFRWLTKCADDSETANYISAHTKVQGVGISQFWHIIGLFLSGFGRIQYQQLFFLQDCPKCNICIEKNGGCNHMQVTLTFALPVDTKIFMCNFQCYNCKHDFCWMCLGDWRSHGSEYYECSRYKVCICALVYVWILCTRLSLYLCTRLCGFLIFVLTMKCYRRTQT